MSSTAPQILTVNIICPTTPSVSIIGSFPLFPPTIQYTLNSGPVEFTGIFKTMQDDTFGQCFTYVPFTKVQNVGVTASFITYDWQNAKITVNTNDPTFSAMTHDFYNEIRLSDGTFVDVPDLFSIEFLGGCATSQIVAIADKTYPSMEF